MQSQTMPHHGASAQANGSSQNVPWGAPFPSLHLWPIQDTFAMKMIHLPEAQRIKIGRQTNNKTIPGERNAYFDSKVLSRTHAEIWEQGSKIYIKDLKSSNGTFINNERLSPEGVESEPFEVKSEDIVEFGIDIVSEDNRTIVHHKVAAKVYCVFNTEDAALSARELVHYQGQDARNAARAPAARPPQPGVMGAPVLSSGGKPTGLSFDHVLSKLSAELQKSRETGAELQELSTAMTDIQETLGGGLPPTQNGSANHFIPPQFQAVSAEGKAALAGPHGAEAAAVLTLQSQLGETQSTLNSQLDKIRHLEGQMQDHQSLRDDLSNLREQMESHRRDVADLLTQTNGDDDDARSVATITDRADHSPAPLPLLTTIQGLSAEIADAVQISRSLQSQHSETLATVQLLSRRIEELEAGLAGKIAEEVGKAEKKWQNLTRQYEDGWRKERENWEAERERLRGVVREWEEASRRGHEEVEDRELNERLSEEDEYDGSDRDDDANSSNSASNLPRAGNGRSKARRRRPSHRTALAVRAIKSVIDETGTATPKADTQALDDSPEEDLSVDLGSRQSRRGASRRRGADRTQEPQKGKGVDRDSSESGRDSGDTLKESAKGIENKRGKTRGPQVAPLQQPIPVFTVLIVAVVAGALYWKHKE